MLGIILQAGKVGSLDTKINIAYNRAMTTEIHTKNQIVFRMDDQSEEMLRIAQDGFYVRGVRVPVDDKEAETVYNSFQQWLAWAQLQRQ